jgi:hypothetical protein
MSAKTEDGSKSTGVEREEPIATKASPAARREIPGNLPYLTATGSLKRVLDKIIEAQRPDRFNLDFLENVIKLTGGSARATLPILKRIGFLASDGTPTDLYAKFKTESGRSFAAFQGLRNGFAEIFKRSEYAHTVDDNKLKDIIVEITGLQKNDAVANAIRSTFNVLKSYITDSNVSLARSAVESGPPSTEDAVYSPIPGGAHTIGLSYNINIVLPETSDITVLNAIFRALKENLLQ